jgi:hypothetical protein
VKSLLVRCIPEGPQPEMIHKQDYNIIIGEETLILFHSSLHEQIETVVDILDSVQVRREST